VLEFVSAYFFLTSQVVEISIAMVDNRDCHVWVQKDGSNESWHSLQTTLIKPIVYTSTHVLSNLDPDLYTTGKLLEPISIDANVLHNLLLLLAGH
jgi:hypothetical protein